MKKKKIYLTSKPIFVLSFVLTAIFVALCVLSCVFIRNVGVFPIILSALLIVFSAVCIFVCFNNYIAINLEEKEIKLSAHKYEAIPFKKVLNVFVEVETDDDEKAHCNIVFEVGRTERLICPAFFAISKRNVVENSQKVVDKLYEYMGIINAQN